jgi:choice-of-anchor B domain-containing protein
MQVVTYNGPDADYRGREIAFAYNVDTITVVDVSNKSAMTQVSRTLQPARGYVHQGWLTPDQRYLVSNDELDERNGLTGGRTRTHFWDMANLDAPVYKGYYQHDGASVDHNLYIVGDLVFQSNYTSGLRVFRLGNLSSTNSQDWMSPVAWFDTYLANDSNSFDGAWNNYPFFPSGNIAISDINGGLFMVKLNLPGTITENGWNTNIAEWAQNGIGGAATQAASVPEPAVGAALALVGLAVGLRRRGH